MTDDHRRRHHYFHSGRRCHPCRGMTWRDDSDVQSRILVHSPIDLKRPTPGSTTKAEMALNLTIFRYIVVFYLLLVRCVPFIVVPCTLRSLRRWSLFLEQGSSTILRLL